MDAGDRAQISCFAQAVSALAREAGRLADERGSGSREALVAQRAADQAFEAAALLDASAREGATLDHVMATAAWALTAAAVAVTCARDAGRVGPTAALAPVAPS